MNQRQLTLQTFLQKQQVTNQYQLPNITSTNSVPTNSLWSEKYCQRVLRVSHLKQLDESQQKQKRFITHIKVQKFFQKPKFEKVDKIYQAAEIYGFNQIIQELDRERVDLLNLSERIERSASREDKSVKFRRNRKERKQEEFIEYAKDRFTNKPFTRSKSRKKNKEYDFDI